MKYMTWREYNVKTVKNDENYILYIQRWQWRKIINIGIIEEIQFWLPMKAIIWKWYILLEEVITDYYSSI